MVAIGHIACIMHLHNCMGHLRPNRLSIMQESTNLSRNQP